MIPQRRPASTPSSLPATGAYPSLIGKRLDQFQILRELGQGGMGKVYEAEDTLLRRRVAIKLIRHPEQDQVSALLREARAAAALDHPNIVRVHHIGTYADGNYLVLELVPGGSLQDRLNEGRVTWSVATWALGEACLGLIAAHARGLIHRDIKPANLLCGQGQVKVADFGLARGGVLTTMAGNLLAGTPHYMSPEQCRGEPADERSDIYALGATYFHLLTGRPPFTDATPAQVMFAHCTRAVPDASSSDVPAACAAIVRKAMAKEPAQRYQSVAEVLAALRAIIALGETKPLTPVAPPKQGRPLVLAGILAAVAALFVVAGILAVTLWAVSGRQGQPNVPVATPGKDAAGPLDQPLAFVPTIPPEGRRIPVGGKVRAVAFSPDGTLLASGPAGQPGGLTMWNLATGKVHRRLDWGAVNGLAFSQRPEKYYLVGCCTRGPHHWFSDTDKAGPGFPEWDNWGTAEAVATKDEWRWAYALDGTVHIYLHGGRETGTFPLESPVHQIRFAPGLTNPTMAVVDGSGQPYLIDSDRNVKRRVPLGGTPRRPAVVAFAPAEQILAYAYCDRIRFWAYPSHKDTPGNSVRLPFAPPRGEGPTIRALDYSPDGKHLAAADDDGTISVVSTASRTIVHSLKGEAKPALAVVFHPSGGLVAAGYENGQLWLWDVRAALGKEKE